MSKIISQEAKPIIIKTNVPLILAYPLPYNMTLISSNYPIAIEYNKVKTIQGIHLLQGNDIYIQGSNIDNNLREFKQPEVLPLIIKNHQRSFKQLNTLILSTMATPAFKQFGIEFHTSITSLTLVIFIILTGIIYLLFKHKNKGC